MNLSKKNLDRLRQLEAQLNQANSLSDTSNKAPNKTSSSLHPIETEENPEILFRELIKASPDGQVPDHLITRLKEIEAAQLSAKKEISIYNKKNSNALTNKTKKTTQGNNIKNINSDQDNLYALFHSLILEEEEDL